MDPKRFAKHAYTRMKIDHRALQTGQEYHKSNLCDVKSDSILRLALSARQIKQAGAELDQAQPRIGLWFY